MLMKISTSLLMLTNIESILALKSPLQFFFIPNPSHYIWSLCPFRLLKSYPFF